MTQTEHEEDLLPCRKRPGPRPRFELEDLVREALAQGLDKFSLSAIAKSLGVASPALYRIVESRSHLLYACFDVIGPDMPKGMPGAKWQDIVRKWTREVWDVCDKYLGLDRVLIECPDSQAILRSDVRKYVREGDGESLSQEQLAVVETAADIVLLAHLAVSTWNDRKANADPRVLELRNRTVTKYRAEEASAKMSRDSELQFEPVRLRIESLITTVKWAAAVDRLRGEIDPPPPLLVFTVANGRPPKV
ncbi:TetR/AcrR family transcriptional regulator [Corynebacterium flavescens]|uniref:TetR/AcrR family transcriptional regulator n=1 Tax=Corynebacterium flavescens TaxID=28028 RepID=UPI0012EED8B2|nr:TetR family transcriptional regulator [Corynebacterium flavescens]